MVDSIVHLTIIVAFLAMVFSTAGCVSQTSEKAGPVLWHEGEKFATATDQSEKQWDQRESASAGGLLYGGTLDAKNLAVTWRVSLTNDMPNARIIFRYARLHWRENMVPAPMEVTLTGPATAKAKIEFPNTGGWGNKPKDWGLAEAMLGTLVKGDYTVTLTSLADNNSISVDGFFIAPPEFRVTADELAALRQLTITAQGYLGVRTAAIVRQDQDPAVWIGAKVFCCQSQGVTATIRSAQQGSATTLAAAGSDVLSGTGMESLKFTLPKLPDGEYVIEVTAKSPACAVAAKTLLAGDLLGSLDTRLARLSAALKRDQSNPAVAACLVDIEHIIEYLKTNQAALSTTAAAGDNPFKAGLAFHEGASSTSPVIDNMRRALQQAEAAIARIDAGKAPYDGVTGELRRSFLSAADPKQRYVYRMFVPSAYFKKESTPLILFLHGGGGNEDYWPDMQDGYILKALETRGYMALMPKWHSRNYGDDWPKDMMQLVELARKEYPQIDPKRIYVTGISMGGHGTYVMTTTYPDYFAAGCCVSGTGKVELAAKLKTTPLLILQGGSDTVVPPAGAKAVDAELQKLGYARSLHIFPTWGHGYHPEEYLKLTLDWFDKYHK